MSELPNPREASGVYYSRGGVFLSSFGSVGDLMRSPPAPGLGSAAELDCESQGLGPTGRLIRHRNLVDDRYSMHKGNVIDQPPAGLALLCRR